MEKGLDRDGWGRQERCAFLSVFALCVHLYLYHFVYLAGLTLFFFTHSHWWNLGKEWKKGEKRSRQPGCIPVTRSSYGMFSVSITYSLPLQDHPHKHNLDMYNTYMESAGKHTAPCCFKNGHTICNNSSLDHLLASHEPFSPCQLREIKRGREGGREGGGECFCVVSRNIVLWMQCLQCCCRAVCVCMFSRLDAFGLTCPQGWIKPVKDFTVCARVCERRSEMY